MEPNGWFIPEFALDKINRDRVLMLEDLEDEVNYRLGRCGRVRRHVFRHTPEDTLNCRLARAVKIWCICLGKRRYNPNS